MNEKHELTFAFSELERDAVHPSPQEIAEALEGLGSPFAQAEIRAHAGWCSACRKLAAEFEDFAGNVGPAVTDQDWQAMQRRLPSTTTAATLPASSLGPWFAAAAGFAICAAGASLLWVAAPRPEPKPVIVEKRIEVPTPIHIANAAVVDLMPSDARQRGPGGAVSSLPEPLPEAVTFILNDAAMAANQTSAQVLDGAGKVVWKGALKRQHGVFTLALGVDILRARPLTIELTDGEAAKPTVRYRIPR